MKNELFDKPETNEEAYDKWKIATRTLRILIAAGFVPEKKVNQAIELVRGFKD